tara:strand:- start:339 stop:440 length:102 start_codon:yes stop_codon:yes gene_type:complete
MNVLNIAREETIAVAHDVGRNDEGKRAIVEVWY